MSGLLVDTGGASGVQGALTDDPPPNEFDWSRDGSVVLALQPATAVYMNKSGAVVIRQEGIGDADDQYATLGTVEAVRVLIAGLEREIGGAR